MELNLDALVCFQSFIYKADKSDLLPSVKDAAEDYLRQARVNKQPSIYEEVYPVDHTDNFNDERTKDFRQFICDTAWSILQSQAMDMTNLSVHLIDMWLQSHNKHSLMEQHVHGYGCQISGFYFLEVPKDSCEVMFHDPRPGKVQISMGHNYSPVTAYSHATNALYFEPEPGMLLFTNSWLPHSFTRNRSDNPVKFIHFDLGIRQKEVCDAPIII